MDQNPLKLSEDKAVQEYDNPEEFTEAIVDQMINDLTDTGAEVPRKRKRLYKSVRSMVRDELWYDDG